MFKYNLIKKIIVFQSYLSKLYIFNILWHIWKNLKKFFFFFLCYETSELEHHD